MRLQKDALDLDSKKKRNCLRTPLKSTRAIASRRANLDLQDFDGTEGKPIVIPEEWPKEKNRNRHRRIRELPQVRKQKSLNRIRARKNTVCRVVNPKMGKRGDQDDRARKIARLLLCYLIEKLLSDLQNRNHKSKDPNPSLVYLRMKP
jgi:hypothetical protein